MEHAMEPRKVEVAGDGQDNSAGPVAVGGGKEVKNSDGADPNSTPVPVDKEPPGRTSSGGNAGQS